MVKENEHFRDLGMLSNLESLSEQKHLTKESIMKKSIEASRIGPTITPDQSRVLLRPFYPIRQEIAQRIIDHVAALTDKEIETALRHVLDEFDNRHENVKLILQNRFLQVQWIMNTVQNVSPQRQALIGSYFLMEYSPESAALFNPSIVLHPDQSDLPEGSLRFILSLRATGEGHISSITFRTGVISAQHRVTIIPPVPFVLEPEKVSSSSYEKALFLQKLEEAGIHNHFCRRVMEHLHDVFNLSELKESLSLVRSAMEQIDFIADQTVQGIMLLAESNYEVRFYPESRVSQRILFPSTPSQRNGIEDARFVRFQNDDGSFTYFATYTAYDGSNTLSQLLETDDFTHFKFSTLNGPAVQNKGMALFPRKIEGKYVMLSRQDDENILIMHSDNVHFWQTPSILIQPAQPWEFVKIGTCGSSVETEAGWLVISHGVGPMRKYCLGAFLLDLNDPTVVIGRLKEPLLVPNESEREGYVPNVVYTCGFILHGRELIIPYAMSDYATSFAKINLDELLLALKE